MSTISRIARRAGLGALVATAACTSYSRASRESLTPQRTIRVRFSAPQELHLACDAQRSTSSPSLRCDPDTTVMSGIVSLEGRVQRSDADSVLVSVSEARDSLGNPMTLTPPRSTWVASKTSLVEYRHSSPGRTVALVVLTAVTVVATIAALSTPDPEPKTFSGGWVC